MQDQDEPVAPPVANAANPDDEAMLFRLNLFGKVEDEDKA